MTKPDPLTLVLAGLQAAGLANDVTQVLDALWLGMRMPEAGAVSVSAIAANRSPAALPPAPDSLIGLRRAEFDESSGELVDVELGGDGPQGGGVFAQGGDTVSGDLRARSIRVAGVAALRDAAGMARALRPLGKRRRSHSFFEFDEVASIERLAETGALVPRFRPRRERFFATTLLVEDSPSLPLWLQLADELEALLARQGGFRLFQRYTLSEQGGHLKLRSGSGAWLAPGVLNDDDTTLVLLATDGTSGAWSDGRMAALLETMGRHGSVAVVQWMPERRWPHTALGVADLQVALPRPGASNSELRVRRPRWLSAGESVVPVPVVALNAASFARLSAMLMAKPGAWLGAAMLWRDGGEVQTGEDDLEALSASERVARFRGLASARVLQAAVQLSAAAPLTLPVVRLVHHVLQPDAPAEDLPLLLLGGLLERRTVPDQKADGLRDADQVEFDFAPGVRALLQRSLLRSEADAVRRAVSEYIAKRAGTSLDFNALLLDPKGALSLPDWARPFAEVTQQVRQLFSGPPAAAASTVQERQWAPGITVQAEAELSGSVRQIAWSRDGSRLAVLHEFGLQLLRLHETGPGRRSLVREPLEQATDVPILFVKGFDLDDDLAEAFIDGVRQGWATHFNGRLVPMYHTVPTLYRTASARNDIARLTKAIPAPRGLICCIGGPGFEDSPWLRDALVQWTAKLDLTIPPPLLGVFAARNASGTAEWSIRRLPERTLGSARGDATAAASVLLHILQDLGRRALPQVAFGESAHGIAWDSADKLVVADTSMPKGVVFASTRTTHPRFPPVDKKGRLPLMALHPLQPVTALALSEGIHVATASRSFLVRMPEGAARSPIVEMDWSPDGTQLAIRTERGAVAMTSFREARPMPPVAESFSTAEAASAGPLWSPRGAGLTLALAGGNVFVHDPRNGITQRLLTATSQVDSMAWSHDGQLFAASEANGHISLVDDEGGITFPRPEGGDGELALLAFVPRVLDVGFESLVVTQGRRLVLLRVRKEALRNGEPWPRRSVPREDAAGRERLKEAELAEAQRLLEQGRAAEKLRDFDKAQALYHEALATFERHGDEPSSAQCWHQLGAMAYMRGDLETADACGQRSLEIEQRIGSLHGMAISYHLFGLLAEARGALDSAEQSYRQSLTLDEQAGNAQGVAATLHQLGDVNLARDNLEEAEAWYQRSLEIERQLGNEGGAAITYHQLGELGRTRGELDAAVRWFETAIETRGRLGDEAGLSVSCHQLGLTFEQMGDFDAAEHWYRRSLEIDQRLGNSAGATISTRALEALRRDRQSPSPDSTSR